MEASNSQYNHSELEKLAGIDFNKQVISGGEVIKKPLMGRLTSLISKSAREGTQTQQNQEIVKAVNRIDNTFSKIDTTSLKGTGTSTNKTRSAILFLEKVREHIQQSPSAVNLNAQLEGKKVEKKALETLKHLYSIEGFGKEINSLNEEIAKVDQDIKEISSQMPKTTPVDKKAEAYLEGLRRSTKPDLANFIKRLMDYYGDEVQLNIVKFLLDNKIAPGHLEKALENPSKANVEEQMKDANIVLRAIMIKKNPEIEISHLTGNSIDEMVRAFFNANVGLRNQVYNLFPFPK